MTTTRTGALETMLAHHGALTEGVKRRVETLTSARVGAGQETAAADLVAYGASEVLPHAMAEEQTVYLAAAGKHDLAETVAGMVDEHRSLAASLERLATAGDPVAAVEEAKAIGALFAAHVAKENELILPPLVADEAVDLGAVLEEMHRLIEAAHDELAFDAREQRVPDIDAALLRLLLEATGQMAAAGSGDRACRLAAEAWAAVRVPRPDLAVRVTAALHRLVRSISAEPVTFSAGPASPESAGGAVLDVRALAPAQRHEKIFATYGALAPGTGFVLVNDHDPKPLRYQFEAEHAAEFTWDVLEAGPQVWRVRIGRLPEADSLRGAGPRLRLTVTAT